MLKPFAIFLLAASLAGCVDANLDVQVTGAATAKATLTQTMRSDFYAVMTELDTIEQAQYEAGVAAVAQAEGVIAEVEAQGKDSSLIIPPPMPERYTAVAPQFCTTGVFLARADGGATCIDSQEGAFASLNEGGVSVTPEEPGLVRISIATADIIAAVRAEQARVTIDDEVEALLPALFANRRITLRFSGDGVLQSNMTVSKDRLTASKDIPILDLMTNKLELPDTFYAVVRIP